MDQDRDATSARADGAPSASPVRDGRKPRLGVGLAIAALNLLVFAAWEAGGLPRALAAGLALGPEALEGLHPWALVGAAFVHLDPLHLLGTSAVLLLCGRHVEAERGGGALLIAWLLGGLACALGWLVSPWNGGLPAGLAMTGGDPGASTASGAALAVAALALASAPRRSTAFLGIELPLLALVAAFVLCDLLGLPRLAPAADLGPGAHLHHLAGLPAGLLLAPLAAVRDVPAAPSGRARAARAPVVTPSIPEGPRQDWSVDPATAERVDDLLRKIHREGLEALDPEERRYLEDASGRFQRIVEPRL